MKKLNIVLDLDNTIIYGEEYKNARIEKIKKHEKFHVMDNDYYIIERPYLQEFLTFLFDNFNVSVWTAASKNYGLFIIQKIILINKNRKIDWFFHSDHCAISSNISDSKEQKDLNILYHKFNIIKYTIYNTIIIDDNDLVYETQPNNCIHIKPFKLKDNEDNILKKIQKYLSDEFLNLKNIDVKKSVNKINSYKNII